MLEKNRIGQIIAPMSSKDDVESKFINLKNYLSAILIVNLTQVEAHGTKIELLQAKNISGDGEKVISKSTSVWSIDDVDTDIVRKTISSEYTVEENIKKKQIVFQIKPTLLDINEGYTCIGVKVQGSGKENNLVSSNIIFLNKYSD